MYTLRHCVENIKFIYDASHRANKWVACASRMQISIDMSRVGGRSQIFLEETNAGEWVASVIVVGTFFAGKFLSIERFAHQNLTH